MGGKASPDSGNRVRLAVTAAENAGPAAPILLRGDLHQAVREAGKIGYAGVEIHVPDIWNFDAEALAKTCHREGVAISALVSGQLFVRQGLSLTDPDPAVVAKAVEGLQRFVGAAEALDSSVVVGWVRGKLGERRDEGRKRQAEAMAKCGEAAGKSGVPIHIEAINRYEIDNLNTAGDVLSFIRDNALPNVYVHLDTFHMNIEEFSAVQALRRCGPLLGYVHLAENTRWYPGHDGLDFARVFDTLAEIGYSGFTSVECLPYPSGSEAAQRAFEYLSHRFVC